jgi:hypothetical protein
VFSVEFEDAPIAVEFHAEMVYVPFSKVIDSQREFTGDPIPTEANTEISIEPAETAENVRSESSEQVMPPVGDVISFRPLRIIEAELSRTSSELTERRLTESRMSTILEFITEIEKVDVEPFTEIDEDKPSDTSPHVAKLLAMMRFPVEISQFASDIEMK